MSELQNNTALLKESAVSRDCLLEGTMRRKILCTAIFATMMLVVGTAVSAEVRRVAYPQVKVELAAAYTPDAAFNKFRTEFINAITKKDAQALFALVAPGFVWTLNDSLLTGNFDPGRDPQHNFRVVFGFRATGKDADGDVENGPFWDALAAFANDGTFYQANDNVICGPAAVTIVDDDVFEQARAKIETSDEGADWYFIVRSTPVIKAPDDKDAPIATAGLEAVPVLNTHPPSDSRPTHFQVLLPSGRTGWISANAARPLQSDRLCYALKAKGEWNIAIYDSAE
jgi:hypothetical protein